MSSKGFMLIDESNWGHAAAATQRLSIGEQETHVVFGFIRRLRSILATFPMLNPISLADGISWRYERFPEYKASRNKEPETKQELKIAEIRKGFKSQKKLLIQALGLLGVRRMHALNLEADDLAAMLVKRYAGDRRILMLSGDKDWLQLVRPSVTWMDVINDRRIGFKTFSENNKNTSSVGLGFERAGEWVGISRPDQWADVKCLMGDTSDGVPGVGGIGEKGAIELVRKYGSVANFFNMVLDKSLDVDSLPKKLKDFALSVEKNDIFRRNDMLMNLDSRLAPKPNGLTLSSPKLDKEGFREFCSAWMFQSILTDFDNWIEPFEGVTS